MAFLKDVEFNGLNVANAYVSVVRVEIQEDMSMNVVIAVRATQLQTPLYYQGYETKYDPLKSNVMEQAYEFLKTLPEFSGALETA